MTRRKDHESEADEPSGAHDAALDAPAPDTSTEDDSPEPDIMSTPFIEEPKPLVGTMSSDSVDVHHVLYDVANGSFNILARSEGRLWASNGAVRYWVNGKDAQRNVLAANSGKCIDAKRGSVVTTWADVNELSPGDLDRLLGARLKRPGEKD